MLPYVIRFGDFGLPTYGVMAALGMIFGLSVVVYLSKRNGIDPDKTWNLGIILILSAIIGAKILYIINDWQYYADHPGEIFSIAMLQAGGVWYGGVLGALIAAWWYTRRANLPGLATADVFAPGVALGHAFGRLGCLGAGCCYGAPTEVPWAVTFHNEDAHRLVGTPLGIPLHPTQLYEFGVEVLNFLFLFWLIRRKKFDGQIIGTYLFTYGVARFVIEYFRGDPGRGQALAFLTNTQIVSIALVIGAGILWIRGGKRQQVATA